MFAVFRADDFNAPHIQISAAADLLIEDNIFHQMRHFHQYTENLKILHTIFSVTAGARQSQTQCYKLPLFVILCILVGSLLLKTRRTTATLPLITISRAPMGGSGSASLPLRWHGSSVCPCYSRPSSRPEVSGAWARGG
jgi:hypothetical protein